MPDIISCVLHFIKNLSLFQKGSCISARSSFSILFPIIHIKFSKKIRRRTAPCVAVAVDNAASIWRFCRIFRIIKFPECIRTVAYHSAPVIFHIFHCLVFFITHQKCFHKMMVHIWRNHSFFRFQFHQTIQYFCSFFAADCFRQNNPYLTCS